MRTMPSRLRRTLSAAIATIAAVVLLAASSPLSQAADGPGDNGKYGVRVLVITMFSGETQPWLSRESLPIQIDVPTANTPLHCSRSGLCVATVGEGKSNAATSMMAILDSPRLDLHNAYFITAGIAGASPKTGTLGFAAWARWVVDWDLGHHLLPETAPGVPYGYLRFDDQTNTNAFRLNDKLINGAYELTKNLPLSDSAEAVDNRSHYAGQAGQHPYVARCDTMTGDDYWNGAQLSEEAQYITGQWTNNQGVYCTTQMEDNATAAALARHGLLDRYLSLRTASDFDQPYPGQSVRDALAHFPGYQPAVDNEYLVGSTVAHYLLTHPSLP